MNKYYGVISKEFSNVATIYVARNKEEERLCKLDENERISAKEVNLLMSAEKWLRKTDQEFSGKCPATIEDIEQDSRDFYNRFI